MNRDRHILTINSGSSSLKFSLYVLGADELLVLKGQMGRIGVGQGFLQAEDHQGHQLAAQELTLPNHEAALKTLFAWLQGHEVGKELHAVGHRLVHGGMAHVKPQEVSPALIAQLKLLVPLAPDHLPHEIKALEGIRRYFPQIPQVACFDTSFHRRMPEVAQRYALPGSLFDGGLRRYGFHGLSYEYLLQELAAEAGAAVASGRLIMAHLGNGASMVAVNHGRSLDTTMGLTPTGGLVMGTRIGDLDPGVILYLLQEKSLSLDKLNHLLNQQAGLLGTSGISSDMQDLLARVENEPPAALAVELFCYQAGKFVGALAAVLGGLDTFIFSGGIGENSAIIRARICANLAFLGIHLDADLNKQNRPVISQPAAPVTVRVMRTNEELMIARHTRQLLDGR